MALLTRTEEFLLLSVWRLQHDAYGLAIKRQLTELINREISVGAVYVPLERLVMKGFLETRESLPTDKRGGRRKRFYRLTGKGMKALSAVREVQSRAWFDLPNLAFG